MRAAVLSVLLAVTAPAAMAQQQVTPGSGAHLRALEKVSGALTDFELRNGASRQIGRMTVTLRSCRYPPGNPAGEAFAFLTITEEGREAAVFEGWMIASSPALNALEHPRYDVWVLRCSTE